jgi:hypothetical protein
MPVSPTTLQTNITCGHVAYLWQNRALLLQGTPTKIYGMAETTITPIIPGSSGSPVYKDHVGYGTLTTAVDGHETLDASVSRAESQAGVQIYGF